MAVPKARDLTVLDQIVVRKRAELVADRAEVRQEDLERKSVPARRGFRDALERRSPAVIAEIKKASPSAGLIAENFDPGQIARGYEAAGAAALSVLTDRQFFQGSLDDLAAARAATSLPVLRKDFTLDRYHLLQASSSSADCVLLIVAVLDDTELRELMAAAKELRLDALVEVHDGAELQRALDAGADLVGVNNRNLKTMEVTLQTSLDLADRIPPEVLRISESGIRTTADLRRLSDAGYQGFLVGESLMRQPDRAAGAGGPARDQSMSALARQAGRVLETIKFQHSVFALPFALTGALLALRGTALGPEAVAWKLVWIVVAMVAARSAAMAFNRLADARIDGRNPRTASRALPAGLLTKRFTALFVALSCAVFVAAAGQLNPLCLQLSPVVLAIALGYSFAKRFTLLSHLVLGAVLGIAPAAAWIAIRGSLAPEILHLSGAVCLWTAGFDIIYSCQDVEFDRGAGLHSVPARFGIGRALVVSRLAHAGMVALLLAAWRSLDLGHMALAGVLAVSILLVYEHSLVREGDLSRVNAAFFAVNGWVGVLFFAFWSADIWLSAGEM